MYFKTMSDRKAVSKKDKEKIIMNFLSRLLIPGFFRSSRIAAIKITKIQINIEEPFNEKKAKKESKN